VHGQCDGVRDGITGIIAKDNTPNGLAVAIVEMLSDKGRYEQMRQKAYTWSKEINFNKSYQELKAILKIC
jgi:glycosyltransferase involved in cell wall biosynthesis